MKIEGERGGGGQKLGKRGGEDKTWAVLVKLSEMVGVTLRGSPEMSVG